LNPIALGEKGERLNSGTSSGNTVYRLPAALLADKKISYEKIA